MTYTTNEIAQALFVINKHAKTALEPKLLYQLKKEAIDKLLYDKQAKKIGLQFSDHPKKAQQHSTLLVQVGDYFFHVPPKKHDFKMFQHLGKLEKDYRNPAVKLSLKKAKQIIYTYLDKTPLKTKETHPKYAPTLLGRWNTSYFDQKKGR